MPARYTRLLLLLLVLMLPCPAWCDTLQTQPVIGTRPIEGDAGSVMSATDESQVVNVRKSKPRAVSKLSIYLSVCVLIFGLLALGLELYLIKTMTIPTESFIKFILITLIIISTLFLITAGYDNDQIAPAMGLFGTVAGYLLAKNISQHTDNKS